MMMTVGQKLRQLRKQKKLSLMEVARASGLAIGTLSRLERDLGETKMPTYQRLCEVYGITLSELCQDVQLYKANGKGAEVPRPVTLSSPAVQRFTYNEKATAILLAQQVMDNPMLPQLVILQSGGKTAQEQTRLGCSKWLFVLEGAIEVKVGESTTPLRRYDTLMFKAHVPHQLSNRGKTVAKCISVTSPVGL